MQRCPGQGTDTKVEVAAAYCIPGRVAVVERLTIAALAAVWNTS